METTIMKTSLSEPLIHIASTDEDILRCYPVMKELRPHLQNEYDFVSMIREMITDNQYQMAYIECDTNESINHDVTTSISPSTNTANSSLTDIVAVIGFRYQHNLCYGKYIYIDDLSTLPSYQGNGYGSILLDYVTKLAFDNGKIHTIVLDSGYTRNNAHRFYLNKGFILNAHHFIKRI